VTVRVLLPGHLRALAHIDGEARVEIGEPVTQARVLDALESQFPVLRGTIRDGKTKRRRAFVRFFACRRDLSHEAPDAPLPPEVAGGEEPLLVVGAIAGG
jgi:molybdopterin synthase sulfur carrier subunit